MKETTSKLKILFIGKSGDHYSQIAAGHLQQYFTDLQIVFSERTQAFPASLLEWEGDIIISYLSQWIIPAKLLGKATLAAINFHPGPPEYPGIGCTNFAVYNNETEFGVTCHHMLERVDEGAIIAVRRFPVAPIDTVYSITQRCYIEILHLFYEMIQQLLAGNGFPYSEESWRRKPFTRKQLNELCLLQAGMNKEEVTRRLKATTYGNKIWARVQHQKETIPYEEAVQAGLI